MRNVQSIYRGMEMTASLSAQIFTALTAIVMFYQACLALGLPWGKASMGGKFPGKYPPKMRFVAVANIFILAFMAIIVLSRANLIFQTMMPFSRICAWVVVVFYLAGTIMNTITPSKIERIWAPIALVQLCTSFIVALS